MDKKKKKLKKWGKIENTYSLFAQCFVNKMVKCVHITRVIVRILYILYLFYIFSVANFFFQLFDTFSLWVPSCRLQL